MKALVTGGSGFIGSRLISFLAEKGVSVRVLLRKSSKIDHLSGVSLERVYGDLGDEKSLREAVAGVDVIFHLAAVLAGNRSSDYFTANSSGTVNIMKAVLSANPSLRRFVFVSSLAAGGPSLSSRARSESDDDQPVSHYGKSKLAAEKAIEPFFSQVPVAIIRPPLVYGPRDRATLLLAKIAKGKFVPLVAALNEERKKMHSLIHVDDLVEAMWLIGNAPEYKIKSGTRYYVSDAADLSYQDLISGYGTAVGITPVFFHMPRFIIRIAAKILTYFGMLTGKTFMLNDDKYSEITPDYWICSSVKISSELGYTPKVKFSHGVKETVEWYKKEGWL